SVGGYHAAKLQRYQDLIEHQLSKGNREVVNMLNTKYIIVPDPNKQPVPMLNPDAYGPAWPVSSIKWVKNADEEMMALDTGSLSRSIAVVDERFASDNLRKLSALTDSTATIRLTEHTPNRQVYETSGAHPMLGVFSEIYYPHGWTATIDGQPASIIRANYVLRALELPAGQHRVEFRFDPRSLHITEAIAKTALVLLLLGIVVSVLYPFVLRKKRPTA
ncbi:YfhO family protein, partial [Porphyromonas loveana]